MKHVIILPAFILSMIAALGTQPLEKPKPSQALTPVPAGELVGKWESVCHPGDADSIAPGWIETYEFSADGKRTMTLIVYGDVACSQPIFTLMEHGTYGLNTDRSEMMTVARDESLTASSAKAVYLLNQQAVCGIKDWSLNGTRRFPVPGCLLGFSNARETLPVGKVSANEIVIYDCEAGQKACESHSLTKEKL